MRISDWSSDVCSSDLLLVSFPFGLGFALAGNAYVALACFVVVKFTMTLHLGPIIALCFAQVPEHMRAMMSATINMFIGLAGVGLGGTVAGFLSRYFPPDYGELSLQPATAVLRSCLLVGWIAAIMAGRTPRPPAAPSHDRRVGPEAASP